MKTVTIGPYYAVVQAIAREFDGIKKFDAALRTGHAWTITWRVE